MTYTTDDAIAMLRAGGVDLASELSNIRAAYIDICEDLERGDDGAHEVGFGQDEFEAALRAAI